MEKIQSADLQQQILADVQEMDRLIDSTLEYLRGGAVQRSDFRRVDLTALVQTIAEDAVELGQDVTMKGGVEPCMGDFLSLKRCIANLVQNGVRYGGRVEVALSENAANVMVAVRDWGPGLPTSELDRVFE
ncbi:MAG: ATP-binding protein, partial [Candidatus Protistobacter heckmanni]|nr:ATP-binding protein [Candidatus Protistobacter heckmanni]